MESVLNQIAESRTYHIPNLLVDTLRANNQLIAQEKGLTDRVAMLGKLSGDMLQLLQKYPGLMQQAQDTGLTDTELRQAKGAAALAQIRENGLAAQNKLLENAIDGMDSYDPAACVCQIAQMRLADQKIAENYKQSMAIAPNAKVPPPDFQLQLGKAPTLEAALREMDKGFKPIVEKAVAGKSTLDLVNEWVGRVGPAAPVQEKKKAAAAEKEQPQKKTDAEIRKGMQEKLRQKVAQSKRAKPKQKQNLP